MGLSRTPKCSRPERPASPTMPASAGPAGSRLRPQAGAAALHRRQAAAESLQGAALAAGSAIPAPRWLPGRKRPVRRSPGTAGGGTDQEHHSLRRNKDRPPHSPPSRNNVVAYRRGALLTLLCAGLLCADFPVQGVRHGPCVRAARQTATPLGRALLMLGKPINSNRSMVSPFLLPRSLLRKCFASIDHPSQWISLSPSTL